MPQTLGSLRSDRKTAPHNEAAADPTINDDSTLGYEIGSLWINTASDNCFMCADATAGAAVWQNLSVGGGGSGDNVQIGGIAVTDVNFNNTTPAAPTGRLNVTWQRSGSGPDSASAHVPNYIGTTSVNFGAFPGASDASVAVTGQADILAGAIIHASLRAEASADHSVDEHVVETIRIVAGNIQPGTGFTIYAINDNQLFEPLESAGIKQFGQGTPPQVSGYAGMSVGGKGTRLYGIWNVQWEWK